MLSNCPFCQHSKARLYKPKQKKKDNSFYDIYLCNECGLIFPQFRLDNKEFDKYSKEVYKDGQVQKDMTWNDFNSRDIVYRMLSRVFIPRGKALDIGSFTGRTVNILNSAGFDAYGLEIDEGAVAFANSHSLKVYSGVFPNKIPLNISQEKYSLITVLECIYYFSNLKISLIKIHELLEPNGFVLIKCHVGSSPYYDKPGNSFYSRYGDYVQGIPTERSLRYCLMNSGFKILYVTRLAESVKINIETRNKQLIQILAICAKIVTIIYQLFLSVYKTKADRIIILAKKIDY